MSLIVYTCQLPFAAPLRRALCGTVRPRGGRALRAEAYPAALIL